MALIFLLNLTCTHLYFFDIFHSVPFQPTLRPPFPLNCVNGAIKIENWMPAGSVLGHAKDRLLWPDKKNSGEKNTPTICSDQEEKRSSDHPNKKGQSSVSEVLGTSTNQLPCWRLSPRRKTRPISISIKSAEHKMQHLLRWFNRYILHAIVNVSVQKFSANRNPYMRVLPW